ncbi:MAG: sulfur carrier protein ThiS [Pseudomonadota bacterium]
MKISVNGEYQHVEAGSLHEVLTRLGYGDQAVATALNESFVPAARRADTPVSEGDRIEIVAPRQGG